jgi:ketosteroid isomerase-like protein
VSDDGVRIVLSVFDAINRRDLATMLSAYAPEAEMVTLTSGLVHGGGYRGHPGIRAYFDSFADVWEELELSADEVRDLGEQVLVRGRWRSRGKGSGVRVEAPAVWLFTLEDHRITASRAFRDMDEALAALEANDG